MRLRLHYQTVRHILAHQEDSVIRWWIIIIRKFARYSRWCPLLLLHRPLSISTGRRRSSFRKEPIAHLTTSRCSHDIPHTLHAHWRTELMVYNLIATPSVYYTLLLVEIGWIFLPELNSFVIGIWIYTFHNHLKGFLKVSSNTLIPYISTHRLRLFLSSDLHWVIEILAE